MQILLRWAIGAVALFITVWLGNQLGLGLGLAGWGAAFIAVLILTLVNALVRPLVSLATLPLNCLTLGLFSFIVNALMFWLVGSLDIGFRVDGFVAALFGSLVMSVVSGLLSTLIPDASEKRRR